MNYKSQKNYIDKIWFSQKGYKMRNTHNKSRYKVYKHKTNRLFEDASVCENDKFTLLIRKSDDVKTATKNGEEGRSL